MKPPMISALRRGNDYIFSVSEFLDILNTILTSEFLYVQGEIGDLRQYQKFIKFTLKDQKDGSVLICSVWKWDYEQIGVAIAEGMEVKVGGYPEIYKPWGQLSFRTRTIEPVGEGALKKAYELLKKKLEAEGLFARKRELPKFIERIGVISSKSGVVIHDFLNNLRPLGFKVCFYDARMEGQEAVASVVKGIKRLDAHLPNLDVLVLIRGGGSLESLQAFDNELVARAVFGSKIPLLCGIGHHVDVPIACLVADVSVSTPSMAAMSVNQSWDSLTSGLPILENNLLGSYEEVLQETKGRSSLLAERMVSKLDQVFHAFQTFAAKIAYMVDDLRRRTIVLGERTYMFQEKMIQAFEFALQAKFELLKSREGFLSLVSPERNLKLGYSIVFDRYKKVVKHIAQIHLGDTVAAKLQGGEFDSRIERISMDK